MVENLKHHSSGEEARQAFLLALGELLENQEAVRCFWAGLAELSKSKGCGRFWKEKERGETERVVIVFDRTGEQELKITVEKSNKQKSG